MSQRTGKSVQKYFSKLQECRKWYADARFEDEHGGINACGDMTVTAWFNYWIENIKGNSIRPNTVRNYKERFEQNIGKEPKKVKALTIEEQKKFLEVAKTAAITINLLSYYRPGCEQAG